MEFTRWNTSTVAPAQQFELYRSGLCASFAHLTPRVETPTQAFSARLETWADGHQSLTGMSAQSHVVERTLNDLKRVEDDHLYLNYVVHGQMSVSQGGTAKRLRAGDMIFIDNARPFRAEIHATSGYKHYALGFPRGNVSQIIQKDASTLTRHPASHLLRKSLALFADAPATLRGSLVIPTLISVSAIMSYFSEHPEPRSLQQPAWRTKDALENLIAERYSDPGFSLETASLELDVPIRTLQHHLALTGTSFSELLRDFRLTRALETIKGRAAHKNGRRSIEDIAHRTGFSDISTFYRAFKKQFGVAPGQMYQG